MNERAEIAERIVEYAEPDLYLNDINSNKWGSKIGKYSWPGNALTTKSLNPRNIAQYCFLVDCESELVIRNFVVSETVSKLVAHW